MKEQYFFKQIPGVTVVDPEVLKKLKEWKVKNTPSDSVGNNGGLGRGASGKTKDWVVSNNPNAGMRD